MSLENVTCVGACARAEAGFSVAAMAAMIMAATATARNRGNPRITGTPRLIRLSQCTRSEPKRVSASLERGCQRERHRSPVADDLNPVALAARDAKAADSRRLPPRRDRRYTRREHAAHKREVDVTLARIPLQIHEEHAARRRPDVETDLRRDKRAVNQIANRDDCHGRRCRRRELLVGKRAGRDHEEESLAAGHTATKHQQTEQRLETSHLIRPSPRGRGMMARRPAEVKAVSYTHLRAHET